MKLALFGYGGHAREVAAQINQPVEFFVDDEYTNEITKPISSFNPETHEMMIAVSNPAERKNVVNRLPKNTKYFTFIHPTVLKMSDDITIGDGSFIGAYSILTTNIKIGQHSILNRGNQIGHDTIIGDYFSAMPGAVVSGNVILGEQVYIGTNSSIKEKIQVYSNVTVGSNAAVVKNIMTAGTYVGVPAKIKKNETTK